jgi:hypothetical protein
MRQEHKRNLGFSSKKLIFKIIGTTSLTPWNRVLLEKLVTPYEAHKIERFVTGSQGPTSLPYPEPLLSI